MSKGEFSGWLVLNVQKIIIKLDTGSDNYIKFKDGDWGDHIFILGSFKTLWYLLFKSDWLGSRQQA